MFEPLIAPSHYEQRAFDVERERVEALRLLGEREANSIALGEHFLRAKDRLSKTEYRQYVASLGLHPLTPAGFIVQARKARGDVVERPAKQQRSNPEAEVLKELIALADRIGPEAAIERARELLNG